LKFATFYIYLKEFVLRVGRERGGEFVLRVGRERGGGGGLNRD